MMIHYESDDGSLVDAIAGLGTTEHAMPGSYELLKEASRRRNIMLSVYIKNLLSLKPGLEIPKLRHTWEKRYLTQKIFDEVDKDCDEVRALAIYK